MWLQTIAAAHVDYQQSKVFIRFILTHAEYDKEDWKKDQWYQYTVQNYCSLLKFHPNQQLQKT
jgi:HigB_toxin, RelE-like toxic component of a toxin-antitoxin system